MLIDAVAQLPSDRVDVRIFGDPGVFPDYAASLQQRARSGLPVQFMGRFERGDVTAIFAQMDVLVVASRWLENSPLVIHEAFMAGVLTSDRRRNRRHRRLARPTEGTASSCRPTTRHALAVALNALIAAPSRLDEMARSAPPVKSIEQDADQWRGALRRHPPRRRRRGGHPIVRPEVSIVVPTRNGVATLSALFEAIAAQTDTAARELIVVDSGSTDGTLDVVRAAAAHVIEIPSSHFNHGTSRNLGLERASGRFVVLTVQDARPISSDWLT